MPQFTRASSSEVVFRKSFKASSIPSGSRGKKGRVALSPVLLAMAGPRNTFRLAAPCARAVARTFRPREGVGNAGCPVAPAASCAKVATCTRVFTARHRKHPAFPHAMVLRLIRALPGKLSSIATVAFGSRFCRARLGQRASEDLTPASGVRTTRLHRPHQRRRLARYSSAHRRISMCILPCRPSHAQRCRVHRISSRVRDDRDTPLIWNETAVTIADLNKKGTGIFFAMGLDSRLTLNPARRARFLSCATSSEARRKGKI